MESGAMSFNCGSGGGVTRSNLINHNLGNLDHSEDGGKKDDKDG